MVYNVPENSSHISHRHLCCAALSLPTNRINCCSQERPKAGVAPSAMPRVSAGICLFLANSKVKSWINECYLQVHRNCKHFALFAFENAKNSAHKRAIKYVRLNMTWVAAVGKKNLRHVSDTGWRVYWRVCVCVSRCVRMYECLSAIFVSLLFIRMSVCVYKYFQVCVCQCHAMR